ncbi:uncharacterized protein LOC124172520 [Ischnura elegans]|uniref:uncharacterized protein LOC124172520 n=1 Tax=Ischnura elegans TaxID=197161 RepID=UPI001ED8ACA7|nr:uncharacterized protein LOC124172520 [Ischnura elegans]
MVSVNGSDRVAKEFVEERLFAGLVTGSFLQHKELLDMLEDVDAWGVRQKTLLHVGVSLGKADCVEELLARGAKPELTDDNQVDALSLAEEMARRFPEDMERSEVLKLVSLVHRRDQVMRRHLHPSFSTSATNTTPVATSDKDIASLKSSVDALRNEMKFLLRQLTFSFKGLKAQVCGRDELLRCLEEAITSTAEHVTSIKVGLGEETAVIALPSDAAKARQECVNAMLCRTTIVHGDGVDTMRTYYERLYDEDDCTACIMKYLCGHDRVKVVVDCESNDIRRMKDKFADLGGTQWDGTEWRSFCDLETETVYFGAKVCSGSSDKSVCTYLAWALSQLSLKLFFGNEALPYEQSDAECECEWTRALQEVEGRKRGGAFHWCIRYALDRRTHAGKVCYLAAAVPGIITYYGSTLGRALLHQHVPLLHSLYCNHVVPTLLAKATR